MADMLDRLRAGIRDVPDFPKKGIIFKDITPILSDHALFRASIDLFLERCRGKEIDKIANRYSFIANPITMTVSGVDRPYEAHLPLHPERKNLPGRIFKIAPNNGSANLLISSSDLELLRKSKVVRLMELFNVEIKSIENNGISAAFHSQDYMKAREARAPLVNWLPSEPNMLGEVVMPDASRTKGPIETNIRREKVGSIIQMVRFGFGRVDNMTDETVTVYYAHR